MTIEDPFFHRGGRTLRLSSFVVLTGGVNANVESGGVNGGTTSLPGAKLTLANYTTQKPTSDFAKLSSTVTAGVNRKSNSSPGSVTKIDSSILPMGGQMKRVENEMSSEMNAVVKKVLLKHPESQAGLRFLFDTDHNDLDEIFSRTSYRWKIFQRRKTNMRGKGKITTKWKEPVGIGPGASQAQYRKPVSNNFNSSQVSGLILYQQNVDERGNRGT